MKRQIILLAGLFLLTSCYEDYVRDYDYSAAYVTYQYDLRTFVVGEGMKFDVSVALAGLMRNDRDRSVTVVGDPSLCTSDLSVFGPAGTGSFTAFDAMLGKAPFGTLAGGNNSYVTDNVGKAGITALTPLPEDYFEVDYSTMKFASGMSTAKATVRADEKILDDPDAFRPYYAIAYKVLDADVDSLYIHKSFAVIAVRCENKYFGNWYHGGSYSIGGDAVKYPFSIPQDDSKVYRLTTVDANTVKTDKFVQNKGSLYLTFDGDEIKISSDDVDLVPDSRRSWSNGAVLLQDRVLYLNYSYRDSRDRIIEVSDSLVFRNRIRDGINEWQDTDKSHYNVD